MDLRNTRNSLVSIGQLASATGISPDRLRIWERRYGHPQPVRLPSGHRRYSADEVSRLKWVAELLARGGRPADLIALSPDELRKLCSDVSSNGPAFPEKAVWLESVGSFRETALRKLLEADLQRLGLLALIENRIEPVLLEAGAKSEDGELGIRHQRFAARVFEDFLLDIRRAHSHEDMPPRVALSAAPGEAQTLPLAALAAVTANSGVPALLLGADTPASEIASVVQDLGLDSVVLGLSLDGSGPETDRVLRELRELLPETVSILVGGTGSAGRRGPRGVAVLRDLRAYYEWLKRNHMNGRRV